MILLWSGISTNTSLAELTLLCAELLLDKTLVLPDETAELFDEFIPGDEFAALDGFAGAIELTEVSELMGTDEAAPIELAGALDAASDDALGEPSPPPPPQAPSDSAANKQSVCSKGADSFINITHTFR